MSSRDGGLRTSSVVYDGKYRIMSSRVGKPSLFPDDGEPLANERTRDLFPVASLIG